MSEETKKEETPAPPAAGATATPAAAAAPAAAATAVAVEPVQPATLEGGEASAQPVGLGLEHLFDVYLGVSVELGTTKLPIETLTKLGPGSVITLDRAATEPVDIYVNGKHVARGEVVTIGDSYGVRITSVQDAGERLKALG